MVSFICFIFKPAMSYGGKYMMLKEYIDEEMLYDVFGGKGQASHL